MIYITFFLQCVSQEESKNIVNSTLKKINNYFYDFIITSNERYDKIKGWYRVECDLNTNKEINLATAKQILNKISDKWEWNDDNTMPDSSAEKMGAKFVHPSIKFVTCYIEDLEPRRNKQNNREVL